MAQFRLKARAFSAGVVRLSSRIVISTSVEFAFGGPPQPLFRNRSRCVKLRYFSCAAALDSRALQHRTLCERSRQGFATSGLGLFQSFAALRSNVGSRDFERFDRHAA
jgi:hypothetical protein